MRISVILPVLAVAFSALFMLSSCEKDGDLTTSVVAVENFVDSTLFNMQRETSSGPFDCYELVFPVTVNLPDGTTAEVESHDELKETVRSWREANMDVRGRARFAFPFEVVNEEGEIITIDSRQDLFDLRRQCGRSLFDRRGPRGHGERPSFCFKPVFPFSVAFPDGTIEEVADVEALRTLRKEWRKEHSGPENRLKLVFPMEVEFEDGTRTTVESPEEVRELKASCAQNSDG